MTIPARSPGCVSCQKGEWLCVFLTYKCPAACSFCPAPFRGQDRVVSALGSSLPQIAEYLPRVPVSGLAFSGGDCFLVFDRLLEWLTFFRRRIPKAYVWAYTSGIKTTERQLRAAAERGLNEIRFNIAATGYRSPAVFELIRASASIFDHVAVEIPAIPEDVERVIRALPDLARAGVHFLNLHEFFITENAWPRRRAFAGRHVFNDVSALSYDVRSRAAMARIGRSCRREGLPIQVHLCTLRSKDIQMRRRRRTMGRLLRRPWERLDRQGFLETRLIVPDSVTEAEARSALSGKEGLAALERFFASPVKKPAPERSFMVRFLPPMEVGGDRMLVGFERSGRAARPRKRASGR